MKINVGSKNQLKINTVKETLDLYPELFPTPEIEGVDVVTDLFGHPKNLKESVEGAIERAKKAFEQNDNGQNNCDFSFGIEGGLMEVPYTKTGYMEVGVCAIYDGVNIYLGLSPAFEWPVEVNDLILSGKADASQAFKLTGNTKHEKLGAMEGGIAGFLTKGRMTREVQTKYSIITALVHLENKKLYGHDRSN